MTRTSDHDRAPPRHLRMTYYVCGHEAGRDTGPRIRNDLCPDCGLGIDRATADSTVGPVQAPASPAAA